MSLSDDDRVLHAARRARVLAAMGEGVMLLPAATEHLRSGDTHYPFRQDSDFGYVTGFPEPDAVAVLAPGAEKAFALFVRPRDPEQAIWVGPRAGVEGAVEAYGADVAHPLEALEKELPAWLGKATQVYLPLGRDDALTRRLWALIRYAHALRPRSGSGPAVLRDSGDILHELRLRKDPSEIVRLRDTIAIAAEAHQQAMRAARPGMHEYEVEALIDGVFRRRGASAPAYPSIVASGANATILHYTANDRPLGADELLLIDAGSERAGYCADITRTFPTGRRFSPAQRDLYDAVLAAQLAAIGAARPGGNLDDLHTVAVRVLAEALIGLGLLEGSVDEVVQGEKHKRFYMHRTSHWLGRDVHDVGLYRVGDAPRALEPGMVFTVEPGLYIPADAADVAEPFRGIGIRIEDDVLVTADGVEVLSAAVPKQAAEIETLRAEAHA
jgi:Xaa-Pro aminopeptidase